MSKLNSEKIISYISYKLKDTLLNLMYDICDSPLDSIDNPPAFLIEISDDIKRLYVQLGEILELDIEKREDFNNKLDAVLERIVKKAVDVNKYIGVNDRLGGYLLREIKLADIRKSNIDIPFNNGAMTENVEHYLSHLDNEIDGKYAKGEVVSVLPLRMTKAKYRDYIKSAFEIMSENVPKDLMSGCMERLKDMFYSNKSILKDDFKLMYESVDEIYKLPVEDLENTEEYFNIVDDNIQQLTNIYSCLGDMYFDIVFMELISDFVIDEDFIFENDFVLKDLYYSICDAVKDNDSTMIDTILDNLNNEIEERFEKSKTLELDLKEIENEEALSDDVKTALNVNNIITSAYICDLDQAIMMNKIRDCTVGEMADELCDYIEKAVEDFDISEQKYMKQKFLEKLPCPMNDDELADYTRYSLDGVNDRYVLLAAYADIFNITDKAEKCENEHHHHHHHHHDDCGCGHHH